MALDIYEKHLNIFLSSTLKLHLKPQPSGEYTDDARVYASINGARDGFLKAFARSQVLIFFFPLFFFFSFLQKCGFGCLKMYDSMKLLYSLRPLTRQRPSVIDKDLLLLLIGYPASLIGLINFDG